MHGVEIDLAVHVGKDVASTGLLAELLFKHLVPRNQKAARRFASRYIDHEGNPLFDKNLNRFGEKVERADKAEQLSLFHDFTSDKLDRQTNE